MRYVCKNPPGGERNPYQLIDYWFPVADLEGTGGPPPPPFLTQVYNVYHFEGQRINNVT